eukprot:gene25475-30757_t
MSKRSEEKGEDKIDILDIVQTFCTSKTFEEAFESFAREHMDVFEDSVNYSVHSKEHPLEFHAVYKKYLTKFEGMIEDYIIEHGVTLADFYQQAKAILEDEETFSRKRFFIEAMLAIAEYENFFMLMQSEMRLQARSHK